MTLCFQLPFTTVLGPTHGFDLRMIRWCWGFRGWRLDEKRFANDKADRANCHFCKNRETLGSKDDEWGIYLGLRPFIFPLPRYITNQQWVIYAHFLFLGNSTNDVTSTSTDEQGSIYGHSPAESNFCHKAAGKSSARSQIQLGFKYCQVRYKLMSIWVELQKKAYAQCFKYYRVGPCPSSCRFEWREHVHSPISMYKWFTDILTSKMRVDFHN